MKRLAVALVIGCSGAGPHAPAAPVETPAASTTCYSGLTTGMGQTARTLVRRALDPAARQITEDVSHDDGGAHGAKSFHVVMAVDGDHFTLTEGSGAFSGTGTLAGDPWRWSSWTSSSQVAKTTITVESDDELTDTGMTATKQIKQDGKLVATTTDQLKRFDCAQWDEAKAALALPALDAAACDRACRNFATLKYWEKADAELAALPQAERAAARTKHESELAARLEAGASACATQCLSANNATQTACMAKAKTIDELGACE
jgi:hypothetical protein